MLNRIASMYEKSPQTAHLTHLEIVVLLFINDGLNHHFNELNKVFDNSGAAVLLELLDVVIELRVRHLKEPCVLRLF